LPDTDRSQLLLLSSPLLDRGWISRRLRYLLVADFHLYRPEVLSGAVLGADVVFAVLLFTLLAFPRRQFPSFLPRSVWHVAPLPVGGPVDLSLALSFTPTFFVNDPFFGPPVLFFCCIFVTVC